MDLLIAIGILLALGLTFGALLGYAAIRFKLEGNPLVDQLDALLPQTQCGQCQYPGCRPYAEALAEGDDVNKCVPGGQETMEQLAALLGVEPQELAPENEADPEATIVLIREPDCIGCTKCIQACPVDAIVGAAKHMHTVITADCTGCDLCIPVCPTDCIEIHPAVTGFAAWKPQKPVVQNPEDLQRIPIQWHQ